jgi:chromosome segregation ATPase
MEVNFDELRDWSDGARRALDRERERMMEQMKMLDGLARATEVIGDIQAENERLQAEVDDLNEQLEQRDQDIEDLRRQHQQEIDDLQRQLLEARNQHLETERQHLETEVRAKPMEIHNHFEAGNSSQVFNDRVSGKFGKVQSDRNKNNKKRNDIKKNKKKWKKTIRKML